MRKLYILIIFLLTSYKYYGQNIPANNNYLLPNIVPPSQETFSSSRINFENSSSGEFSYKFPIFDMPISPVSITYNSGLKVDDIGTTTGLSWQLNAGGVISRIVKDETDENSLNWKPIAVNEVMNLQDIKNAARTGNTIDTEYDWFNFSISEGLSGSFYIDNSLNVYMNSKDDIKISVIVKSAPLSIYGKLLEFIIIDKFGNKYYFGGSDNTIEKTTHQNNGRDQHAVTGWYLYKKITADNKEIIFNYNVEYLNYYTSLNASFNIQQDCSPPASTGAYIYSDVIKSRSILQSYKPKLNTITFDETELKFLYNKQREDLLVNNSENNLLTSIEIKNNNRLITNFNLEYFDVQSLNASIYYGLPNTENSTRKRYFLKSIIDTTKNTKSDFEYYNLSSLPSRFSLNVDYHGYMNGASNSSPFPAIASDNDFGIFLGFASSMPLSILSANKNINPTVSSVGNLKKIIHPTKGSSEIIYEPNSSAEMITKFVKETNSIVVNYNRCNLSTDNPTGNFTFVSNGASIEFYGTASYDYYYNCGQPDSLHDVHSLTITDLTSGNIVFSDSNKVSEPIIAQMGTHYYVVNTIVGHSYKVEYSVSSRIGSTVGNIQVKYNEHAVTVNELRYYGGSRVASIRETNIEGDDYIRKFAYNKLSEIPSQKTSIVDYNATYVMAKKQETSKNCQSGTFPYVEIRDIYVGFQNSILPSFNNRRNKIFYTDITEIIENKSAVERKFSFHANVDPYIGRQPEIYNTPNSNIGEIKSDLLLEENIYKYQNAQFKKIINKTYEYNREKIQSLKSYIFRENFTYYPDPNQDQLINISYGFYENYYGFYSPTKTITTEYLDNNNFLVTTNFHEYGNQNHNQVTSSKIQFSDNSINTTIYNYAHEKGNTKLINANMIGIPLETSIIKKENSADPGKVIVKTEIRYDDPTNLFQTSVLSQNIQTNVMSTELTYDQYDSRGNILQYTTKDGVVTSVIWGYHSTQPIAKLTGVLYSVASALASEIIIASDADINAGTEQTLIDKLDAFRKNTALQNAQVTTYSYDPLIGVTSITPPSGIREIYKYDSANRLESIKDVNGKILKEFQYNYKH